MGADTLFLIWLFGVIVGLVILYYFIQYASGAVTRKKQLKIQTRILLHIAQKQGVEKDTLDLLNRLNDES